LDQRLARTGLFYVRFIEDLLVLAPTRWKLRGAVAMANAVVGAIRLEKHPDLHRLYEQEREGPDRPLPARVLRQAIGRWASGGLAELAPGSPNLRRAARPSWAIRSCLMEAQLRPPREQEHSENRQARQPRT
jgi:hypothetical protein